MAAAHFLGRATRDLAPLGVEQEHEVRQRERSIEAMLDDHDRPPARRHQGPQPLEDAGHAGRIEVGGRLIEHEEPGHRGQHVGDRQALLFASGKSRRRPVLETR